MTGGEKGIRVDEVPIASPATRDRASWFRSARWPSRSPAGIHVALVTIDGVVDLPRTRERMTNKPDEFFFQPDGVADTVYWLTRQQRSAWSFEVEARPFGIRW